MRATKQTVRKYYKYQYNSWTQPVLTENGTVGGTTFAVTVSGTQQGEPYYAFDNNSSTNWRGNSATASYTFYNPNALIVKQLDLVQFTGSTYQYWTTSGTIYGSNDNYNWTSITTYTNNSKDFTIDMSSNNNAYKYYKIQSETSTYRFALTELTVTAQTRTVIEGTSSDYDFYRDEDVYKVSKQTVRKYYKYQENTWTRPNLSSAGTIGGSSFAISVNSQNSTSEAGYMAFDANNTGTYWVIGTNNLNGVVIMYNPVPIKITQFTMTNARPSNREWSGGTIYGSNDNSNYTQLTTFSNSVYAEYATWTVSLADNTNYYKYYKLNLNDGSPSGYKSRICDIMPTAVYQAVVEGTAEDYDFYVDEPVYKVFKINDTYYGVEKQ